MDLQLSKFPWIKTTLKLNRIIGKVLSEDKEKCSEDSSRFTDRRDTASECKFARHICDIVRSDRSPDNQTEVLASHGRACLSQKRNGERGCLRSREHDQRKSMRLHQRQLPRVPDYVTADHGTFVNDRRRRGHAKTTA